MKTLVSEIPGLQSPADRTASELLSDSFARHLMQLAREKTKEYRTNSPFPNLYFDDFLPSAVAENALRDFPRPKELRWSEFSGKNEVKLAFDQAEKLPTSIRDILYFFNSRPMLEFLETLTGINGLIPDPYFVGGGVHQINPGGFLEVHADFNKHTKLKLDRRLNVLLYLNKDWPEEYGGHFELWKQDMSESVSRILPLFNRMAVFSTTSTSYHGHPLPLRCPPDRTRKSIAVYYYSNGRPEEETQDGHDTLFQRRDGASSGATGGIKKAVRSFIPSRLANAIGRARRG